ncbi:valine--tRNA ligase [Mycoplasma sp. CSL10137]|uniref:valine--tRNA ligase n=1 Tax=unclassified Mycoplasma TaxID=2683645 RepID=UPI00197BAEF9|nr:MULTISPECIES: valine--tRNA ligase [unclassified Mycoplasma]MBN4083451.1 valine--tRNA ligase [Mycoplasma sp. CSL10137]MBN4084618.1 valine--tRNA ligase [Mycoplasma sp. CSL10166]
MDKIYNHKEVEKGIEKKWRDKKFFMTHDVKKKPFSILLPPPNVTGKLHIGHALDSYIPDTIIRFKKLKGFDVLWLPGMDHAGIATQSKIEDILFKTTGQTRHDLGYEAFINKIWEWKEEYANYFRNQWQTLGLALDYSRERFTLDENSNEAVLKVFVDLYNKGLIYKGVRAVSWDIKLQTAVSNIEINNVPTEQKMFYIKYYLENSNKYLTVATVRTETLYGDVALVVNPKDKRFTNLVGKRVMHPLRNVLIPIIEDSYVDPKFGTGIMKLSTHAESDIEIIQKHGFELIETIDKYGYLKVPNSQFDKMERFKARDAIGEYLSKNNMLEKVEITTSNISISDRSKTVIETLILPQWFLKMDSFKELILKDLKSKDGVEFLPKKYKKTMKQWMDKVYDWTISRQLWWGHQIPAWYKDGEVKVQIESPGEGWIRETDVLDTWFSSGLAPFVFMGWPKKNSILKRYYPTNLMVAGTDLIFFWIARMYFFGLEFMDKIPFKKVMLHGLVRDSQGRKFSKSLNNGIDPIEVIEKYGSDALRWSLITNSTPGFDLKFSNEKIESAWKINNKLWNIANYINELPENHSNEMVDADKWILDKLSVLSKNINRLMKKYDFTVIGSEIYKFIFNDLSSWYLEFIKVNNNKKTTLEIFKKVLIILHPFMPFITDKIYSELYKSEILEYKWPRFYKKDKSKYIDSVILVVNEIRKYREEYNISKKEVIEYFTDIELDIHSRNIINKMTNSTFKQNNDYLISIKGKSLFIVVSDDQKNQNKISLLKKIETTKFEINRAEKILSNKRFVESAPKEKVDAERQKLEMHRSNLEKYEEELKWKY